MKHCDKCKITINTNKKQCPLCYGELDGECDKDTPPVYSYVKQVDNMGRKNYFLSRLFLFFTFCTLAISIFINILTSPTVWWTLIVGTSILYVWILVRHTIISRRNIFEKALFQFVGVLSIVLATNYVSGGGDWFWTYVVPSAALLTTTVMLIFSSINKKRNDYLLSIFVMSIVLLIISSILIGLNIDTFRLLNSINILYNVLFILAILLFGFKHLKNSLHKNFHV